MLNQKPDLNLHANTVACHCQNANEGRHGNTVQRAVEGRLTASLYALQGRSPDPRPNVRVTGFQRPPPEPLASQKEAGEIVVRLRQLRLIGQVFPVYRSDDSPKGTLCLSPEALHWMSLI
jgi:hypothetical protein